MNMFSRRSPANTNSTALRGTPVTPDTSFSNGNGNGNSKHKKDDFSKFASSPSRSSLTKPKRSLVDSGRLCLLRNRGKSCCLRCILGSILVVVVAFGILGHISDHVALEARRHHSRGHRNQQEELREELREEISDLVKRTTKSLRMNPIPSGHREGDRLLYQEIPDLLPPRSKSWRIITGRDLFNLVQYDAKPLVMGFLISNPSEEILSSNYNLDRHHYKQLERMKDVRNPAKNRRADEEYQIVRIQHDNDKSVEDVSGTPKRDVATWKHSHKRVMTLGQGEARQEEINEGSKDYKRFQPDEPPHGCEPQYEWQSKQFPNCNEIHQIDVFSRVLTLNTNDEPEGILLARGGYRDVWFIEENDAIKDESEVVAMKTLLYEHPWTVRNMDRHRRDALATDRLTGSPNALNLYSYCSNTGIFEFANGGSLEDAVEDEETYNKWDSTMKMKYVYQVSRAIADVHNIDKEGLPSMSHTDISMSQFVSTNDGVDYVINDFNRARFLYRKISDHTKLCPFEVASNKGKFRSPEEYAYEPETEKIDVYSMGNIFFVLLTGRYPLDDMEKKEAMKFIMEGGRDKIPRKYLDSSDPLEQAIVSAIQQCWEQDPKKRATSRHIEEMLRPLAKKEDHHHHHSHHSHHKKKHV